MAATKGSDLEELVRAYFEKQGFFALRAVPLRYEDDDVTDIDVWCYGRQAASMRTRLLIDVKNKRSPKAFERILWVRGVQLALKCDRAIVATTDSTQKVAQFAQRQGVGLLTKQFLARLQNKIDLSGRLTLEQFNGGILRNPDQKYDGDWIRQISEAKSAVVSLEGYPAFNKCMVVFRFFAGRIQTRAQYREQVLRCTYLAAALACVALDVALEQVLYEEAPARYRAIETGVAYGDAGDGKIQKSIDRVLSVISDGMSNGRVIASQARQALEKLFESVRADIIAEYFSKEHNASVLFSVARELEDRAHRADPSEIQILSTEARSVLGVFADFVQAERAAILNDGLAVSPADDSAQLRFQAGDAST